MLQSDIERMQADPNFSLDSSDGVYIVFLCIGIIGYFTIPTVAGWIIQAGGMGGYGRNVNQMACLLYTSDCPTLYWAAIPGNAADFPAEESFHTFIEQAVCLFTEETNYRSSLSPFGIKMVDRLTGKPLHLDISDLPMKRGITTNLSLIHISSIALPMSTFPEPSL